MNRLKIAVVYLQYDRAKYPYSFQYASGLLNKINCDIEYVVVDNYNQEELLEVHGNIHILSGDNANWEFSGWQKGLNYVKENIVCDLILFINDSLRSYRYKMLEMSCLEEMFRSCVKRNLLLGKIDSTGQGDFSFLGYNLNTWVCSNVFAGPNKIFEDCNIDNSCLFDIDSIIEDVDKFLNNDKLGIDLRNHIYNWLSHCWHSKFDVRKNIQLFKNKTKAILNEKLLTAKIIKSGYNVLNIVDGKIYEK